MARSVDELIVTIEGTLGALSEPLRAALRGVDRGRFVRAVDRELAYQNLALPLDTARSAPARPVAELMREHGSWLGAALQPEFTASGATISQPLMYMLAFQLLELAPGDRYLELGSGTGYGAALAAHVVGAGGQVTSVDVDALLVERARALNAANSNVALLHADGLAQPELLAACNKCWITFSVQALPPTFLAALGEGAALLAPIGPPPPALQRYVLHTRAGGQLTERDLETPVAFIPQRGLEPA